MIYLLNKLDTLFNIGGGARFFNFIIDLAIIFF